MLQDYSPSSQAHWALSPSASRIWGGCRPHWAPPPPHGPRPQSWPPSPGWCRGGARSPPGGRRLSPCYQGTRDWSRPPVRCLCNTGNMSDKRKTIRFYTRSIRALRAKATHGRQSREDSNYSWTENMLPNTDLLGRNDGKRRYRNLFEEDEEVIVREKK